MSVKDQFSISRTLEVGGKNYRYFSLQALEEQGHGGQQQYRRIVTVR